MPIPFHCIECDKPTDGNNSYCNKCNKKGCNMGKLRNAEDILKKVKMDIDAYFQLKGDKESVVIDKTKKASCKYCNKDGFYWADTQWGWRLFDDKEDQHMCRNGKDKK